METLGFSPAIVVAAKFGPVISDNFLHTLLPGSNNGEPDQDSPEAIFLPEVIRAYGRKKYYSEDLLMGEKLKLNELLRQLELKCYTEMIAYILIFVYCVKYISHNILVFPKICKWNANNINNIKKENPGNCWKDQRAKLMSHLTSGIVHSANIWWSLHYHE